MKQLISVDWDGTCVENKWPGMGDWLPGAKKTLNRLLRHFDICIFSARISPVEYGSEIPRDPFLVQMEVDGIRRMLDDAGLSATSIWQKAYKPPAIAFVDDRGVHYNGRKGAWDALYTKLMLVGGFEPEEDEIPLSIAAIDRGRELGESAMYRHLLAEAAEPINNDHEDDGA